MRLGKRNMHLLQCAVFFLIFKDALCDQMYPFSLNFTHILLYSTAHSLAFSTREGV